MEQLTQVLRAYAATRPGTTEVRIVADARTHYQEVITLMDAARAAGLMNAALEGSSTEGV
jgi:biopolymer transport protein ExbD